MILMADTHDVKSAGIALGRQMTVEFYDCQSATLTDAAKLEKLFLRAAELSGAHVVDSVFHSFQPQGVSGVVVISESHFAVHAWPEHDYAAVDLFTCGDGVDFDCAIKLLAEGMGSGHWIISSMVNRGIIGEAGLERLVPVVENQRSHGLQLSWDKRFHHSGARAMSSCIDIYNCSCEKISSEEKLKSFAGKLSSILQQNGGKDFEWAYSLSSGEIEFACSFCCGHLSGFVLPEKGNVYLDIFVDGFFDPRTAAEFAIRELEGSYYRMQPQVRQ